MSEAMSAEGRGTWLQVGGQCKTPFDEGESDDDRSYTRCMAVDLDEGPVATLSRCTNAAAVCMHGGVLPAFPSKIWQGLVIQLMTSPIAKRPSPKRHRSGPWQKLVLLVYNLGACC